MTSEQYFKVIDTANAELQLFLCRLIDSSSSASVASRMALYKFDYYYYYYYY